MSGISLATNNQMLKDAETRGQKLIQMVKADAGNNPLKKNEKAVQDELNTTEQLRVLLSRLDDNERDGAPWYMRFGLYSGNTVYKKHLLPIYLSVIEQRFKAPAVSKLEADLRKFANSQPVANASNLTEAEEKLLEKNLNLLKAYLMLSGEHFENAQASHVANTLREYWISESKTPPEMRSIAEQQLEFWAKQIDRPDTDVQFNRIKLDPKLVADARNKLQAFPAPYRYLSLQVSKISKEIDDTIGPTTLQRLLTDGGADAGLMTGSYAVPSAYTRPGLELMNVAITNADEEMKKDDWVMGEAGKVDMSRTKESSQIQDRYLRDYAMHWNLFVRGVDVKEFKNRNDAANAFQAFAGPSSPMRILIREIAKNTNLSAKPEVEDWWPWIKSFFVKPTTGPGNSEPEKAFRPLFTFVGTKDQKAPAETYASEMGKVFASLNTKASSDSALKKIGEEFTSSNGDDDKLEIKKRESTILALLGPFNETGSSQEVAALLQEPLDVLKALLGEGGIEQLKKAWVDQILPAAKDIEKGYPFDDSSSEADLKNLTSFLAPGEGKLSKFYDDKLKNYFEVSNGQYKQKEGVGVVFSEEFVTYLNNALNLRTALVWNKPDAEVRIRFRFQFW